MNQDWKYGTLDDAVVKGSSNISLNKIKDEEGDYPVFGAKGFAKNVSFFQQENEYLAIIKDGAGIGRISKHPKKSSVLATMQYLIPKEGFNIDFIEYFLNGIDFEKYRNGSTIPHIYYKDYKNEQFPILSVPEQKRIVAILDEMFTVIDQAIVNTEINLTNTCELFEGYLNNIFIQKGERWTDMPLSSACIVERGSSPRPIKNYITNEPDGVNWIKIGDTKGVVKFIKNTKQKITKEGAERSRKVNPGDFILTNSMSFGKPYIMATTGYIHDGWFVLRLEKSINSEYFYYLLSSRLAQDQFHSLAAGAIVKNISGDLVKKAILPIAPLEQQEKLVKNINLLVKEIQQLEVIYQQKLKVLTELKLSILQKAFTGELTTKTTRKVANG